MSTRHEAKLRARPVGTLLIVGLVLGVVLGWYMRDFTATRDVVAEAKVRLVHCVQSAMGSSRADWIARNLCAEDFQVAMEKFFDRSGELEQELRDKWAKLRCMAYAHTGEGSESADVDCADIRVATMQELADGLRDLVTRMDEAAAGFWP